MQACNIYLLDCLEDIHDTDNLSAISSIICSRYKLDAKLAIAITCNFVNEASKEEAFVNEISGVGSFTSLTTIVQNI